MAIRAIRYDAAGVIIKHMFTNVLYTDVYRRLRVIRILTHINIHTQYRHIHIHRTYVRTYTYIHTYTHTHTYTYIHTYTQTYTYIHTYIHIYIYTYIHTYIHTHTIHNTYTHNTYIYIHTHTHTHKAIALEKRNWTIVFTWIKALAGNYGNELADKLAKETARKDYISFTRIPKSEITQHVRVQSIAKCQTQWNRTTKALTTKEFFPIIKDRLNTKIKLTPNFKALITTHGKTKAYLHRFKITVSRMPLRRREPNCRPPNI